MKRSFINWFLINSCAASLLFLSAHYYEARLWLNMCLIFEAVTGILMTSIIWIYSEANIEFKVKTIVRWRILPVPFWVDIMYDIIFIIGLFKFGMYWQAFVYFVTNLIVSTHYYEIIKMKSKCADLLEKYE